MANLKVNNYYAYKFRINKDDYWDFFLNRDNYGKFGSYDGRGLNDACLLTHFDMEHADCDDSGWLISDEGYSWGDSVSVGYTLYNITYTGVDNGLYTFRKDTISNKDFPEIFGSYRLRIDEGDTRIKLHAVSGSTQLYDYPLYAENGYVKFNGGFYQGFVRTECDKYQVFPTKFSDGETYNFEFVMKRCDLESESEKTLNAKYPENKGIFFYLGTRSENKWVYLYDKDDKDGLEECSDIGVGDYVDGGEIDKDTYIIGNFYDLDPGDDFDEEPPVDIDDYTDFKYYDEEYIEPEHGDWEDIADYLDIPVERIRKPVDEFTKYVILESCYCGGGDVDPDKQDAYVRAPYFTGCGCPVKYKRKKISDDEPQREYKYLKGCYKFGIDGYIGDWGGLEDDDTDYFEPEIDISDFEYRTDGGFNMSEANWYQFETDNKFLMFDRTKTGKTTTNWVEGTKFVFSGRRRNFSGNLFMLMNRTKTGYTVSDIDRLREEGANSYDPYSDLYENAFALRVTDDGEVGYRMLVADCSKEGNDKTAVIEGYSSKGVIPDCEWVTLNVRVSFIGGDRMKLIFYVNGKLKYVTKSLPRINLRELNDLYEKQEGVPYNMSIGGGTQGLAETIQYNYMLNPTRVYPLERYFAGTFIGYMKSVRVYNCMMEQLDLMNNHKYNLRKYAMDSELNIVV